MSSSVSSSVSSVVENVGTQNSQNKDTDAIQPNSQQYNRVIKPQEDSGDTGKSRC